MTTRLIYITAGQPAFVILNAPCRCSTVTGPSGGHNTASTSNRISHHPTRCVRNQAAATCLMRAAFAGVTLSAGSPYPVPDRVLTSQTIRRSASVVIAQRLNKGSSI